MNDVTPADLAVILDRMALRSRSELTQALRTTRQWADTIKAASYGEDKGGNRWETDPVTGEVVPVPTDPTGDQATDPDVVAQMHGRLTRLMREIRSRCADAEHIMDQASHDPRKHPKRPDDKLDEDRWCQSCKQDRGRMSPVSVHPDGRVRYKGLCRWCHDFTQDYGRRPTAELIRKHHTPYVNVTETDVARAFGIKAKVP